MFPPALLGRMVSIPYYPLSHKMLGDIVRLQLDRIGAPNPRKSRCRVRLRSGSGRPCRLECNDADSGGRMIDNVITNTLLPALSREFLKRTLAKQQLTEAKVTVENGDLAYGWA